MGKPQPKPAGAVPPSTEPPERTGAAGSGSATGFVGTLAQDALDAAEGGNPSGETRAGRLNLPMAREIRPRPLTPADIPGPSKAATEEVEPPERGVGRGMAVMLLLSLAVAMVVVGGWAAGALVYMMRVTPAGPSEVRYPYVSWSYDAGPGGGYSPAARTAAWTLLSCLPVAGVLIGIAAKASRKKE